MKHIRAKPIQTSIGNILPSLEKDKLKDGRDITAGSLFMLFTSFKGSIAHKGKQVKFTGGASGGTVVMYAPSGRIFATNIEKLVEHAIENGWLDPDLKFEEDKPLCETCGHVADHEACNGRIE